MYALLSVILNVFMKCMGINVNSFFYKRSVQPQCAYDFSKCSLTLCLDMLKSYNILLRPNYNIRVVNLQSL